MLIDDVSKSTVSLKTQLTLSSQMQGRALALIFASIWFALSLGSLKSFTDLKCFHELRKAAFSTIKMKLLMQLR